jgi:hypothetical protein
MTTTRKGITVKWETFSPAQAKAVLADNQNGHNRSLSPHRVRRMVVSWDNGEFIDTADTIKFDNKGHLIDGQHRLATVAAQGKPRTFLVARGLRPEAQNVIDAEIKPRSWGDVFQLNGHTNARLLASIARSTVDIEDRGHPMHMGAGSATVTRGLEHMERRPDIAGITGPFVMSFKKNMGNVLTMKEMGVVYEIIRVGYPDEARIFMEEIGTGQAVVRTPGYVAYHQIRKAKADPRTSPTFAWTAAVLFTAWNDVVSGVTTRSNSYNIKPGVEGFPKIKGIEEWLTEGGV